MALVFGWGFCLSKPALPNFPDREGRGFRKRVCPSLLEGMVVGHQVGGDLFPRFFRNIGVADFLIISKKDA